MKGRFDTVRVQAAVRELLLAIGEDPEREGLVRTPERVARAWAEQFAGLYVDPRIVDMYARRPQVQERMTSQIADALVRRLEPRGVIVVIDAEHLCMTLRGVRKPGSRTVTSAVRGLFQTQSSTRAEAMSLILGK